MREVFKMFDADGSGTLDVGELRDVMKSIGLAPQEWEIKAMIAEVDGDDSGQIDWSEFLYLMSKKTVDAENQQRLAFEYFLEPNDRSALKK
jgi:calmodulin